MSKKFKDIYTHKITSTEEREQQLVDSIDVLLPEERVAEYIAKHSDDTITDELVESYICLLYTSDAADE